MCTFIRFSPLVTLVKTEQGWVLVAKDGKTIGYVVQTGLIEFSRCEYTKSETERGGLTETLEVVPRQWKEIGRAHV